MYVVDNTKSNPIFTLDLTFFTAVLFCVPYITCGHGSSSLSPADRIFLLHIVTNNIIVVKIALIHEAGIILTDMELSTVLTSATLEPPWRFISVGRRVLCTAVGQLLLVDGAGIFGSGLDCFDPESPTTAADSSTSDLSIFCWAFDGMRKTTWLTVKMV